MYTPLLNRKTFLNCWAALIVAFAICMAAFPVQAKQVRLDEQVTIDRIQLVTQQISLLKNRLEQSQQELSELQQRNDKQISGVTVERASKRLLDKAALDISVAKSN